MPNPPKFRYRIDENMESFPDHSWDGFLIDFGAILAPSWDQTWSQNRYKRDLQNDKNDDGQDGAKMAGQLLLIGSRCLLVFVSIGYSLALPYTREIRMFSSYGLVSSFWGLETFLQSVVSSQNLPFSLCHLK